MTTLSDIIQNNVMLGTPSTTGWCPVLCPVCHDHGKKGKRASFNIGSDGVAYHCFNCGMKAKYFNDDKLTDGMITVLKAFGIPSSEYDHLILNNLTFTRGLKHKEQHKKLDLYPKNIQIPTHFYRLKAYDDTDPWSYLASEYLEVERKIDINSYTFYLSTDKKWKGRIIFPFYKSGKMIFYQGRTLLNKNPKYKNPDIPKNNILYGFDEVFRNTENPLFIVESFFDAFHIGGVAVLGNVFSQEQIEIINKSARPKIVIPDLYGKGYKLAKQAIDLGWRVALPDFGQCKDVNEAIVQYGKLFVMTEIMNTVTQGFAAEVKLRLNYT